MTTLHPTLHELLEEPANHITFWATSTDVVCPAESPHAYKGTARHLHHNQVWDLVGSHCPRCNDDWGHAKDGLRPCLTRDCYTWKQTGKHKALPRMTEEEIIFEEFEDDMHEYITEDIDRPHPHMGVVVNDYHDKLMKSIDDIKQRPIGSEYQPMPYHEMIADRASPNLNNLSSTGDNMSAPRITESIAPTLTPAPTISKAPTMSKAPTLTSQSTDTKNKEEQI